MKGQKGSALLTVIFIIAITTTIGAALSSMIMYNYRLRSYDMAIQRAEYAAMGIMDNIIFLAKSEINERVEYQWLGEIENKIIEEAEQEKFEYDNLSDEEKYNYIISDDRVYLTLAGEISDSVYDKTHDNYDIMLQSKFYDWLCVWSAEWIDILKNDLNYNVVDSVVDFDEDEIPDIYIEPINSDNIERTNENIIVPLKVSYNDSTSPIVTISANFKILVPSYASADNGSLYSFLDNIIGFSDIKYKDWGHI